MALPLLLLLLLALTLLAHGTLLLARREYQASRAFLHAVRSAEAARSAIPAGLRALEAQPGLAPGDSPLSLLEEALPDGLGRQATLQWLSREFFFLQAQGTSAGWPGVRRIGAVGWRLDPLTRLAEFRGGVETGGGVVSFGSEGISGRNLLDLPSGWGEGSCDPYRARMDSVFSVGAFPAVALLPEPAPADFGPRIPGLGLLRDGRLLERLNGEWMGEAEWNGGKNGEGCPGSGLPRVRVTEGSLTVDQGAWCGLLVASGDLILEGDGRFQGVILVGGRLEVGGSWEVQGMARVAGSVQVAQGALLEISACPVMRVLEGVEQLRAPFLLPTASHLSPF